MELTEFEGIILGIVASRERCTTYVVLRRFNASPTWGPSVSKGAIYPAVRRLRDRGLLASQAASQGQRASEILTLTATGRRALRDWVRAIEPTMGKVPPDPLRTRISYFSNLPHAERLRALDEAEQVTAAALDYAISVGADPEVERPWSLRAGDIGIRMQLEAKLAWLRKVRDIAEREAPPR